MRARTAWDGLEGLSRGLEEDLARSHTAAMRETAALAQQDVRSDTQAAFQGNRLPKTWRARTFPEGRDSVDAAGWIWTRAPELIDAHSRGLTIYARGGRWLAIPTDAAGSYGLARGAAAGSFARRGNRERVTPGGFERRTGMRLRFVYEGGGKALLVADAARRDRFGIARPYSGRGRGAKLYGPAGQTIVVFILVPRVKLPQRLNLDAIAERAAGRYPALLMKHWR